MSSPYKITATKNGDEPLPLVQDQDFLFAKCVADELVRLFPAEPVELEQLTSNLFFDSRTNHVLVGRGKFSLEVKGDQVSFQLRTADFDFDRTPTEITLSLADPNCLQQAEPVIQDQIEIATWLSDHAEELDKRHDEWRDANPLLLGDDTDDD